MNFSEAITSLKDDLCHLYLKESVTCYSKNNFKKLKSIKKIELVINDIIKSIAEEKFPNIKSVYDKEWANCCFDGRYICIKFPIALFFILFYFFQ